MNEAKNILLIRFSSIGDIILTFPLIQYVTEQYPEASIDFLVKEEYKEVLLPINNKINHIITFNKKKHDNNLRKITSILRNREYDLILDLQNNMRSRWITMRLHGDIKRYKKHVLRRWIFIKWHWPVYPVLSVAEKYMRVVNDDVVFKPYYIQNWPGEDLSNEFYKKFPNIQKRKPFILIFPGARHQTKRWPANYFKKLIQSIRQRWALPIILSGDSSERELCEYIRKDMGKEILNVAGEMNIKETYILISQSLAVISNDSAPMHMAALFQKPQLAFWGSTTHHFGFSPLNQNAVILENNSLSCRPCSHLGFNACPEKHFKCMLEVTPEKAIKALEKVLPI